MVAIIIIPITIVAILGIGGYLFYRFILFDFLCKRSIDKTFRRYKIQRSPSQVIREYHNKKGKKISEKEVHNLEKYYRQNEPDQFLMMYDEIRDQS